MSKYEIKSNLSEKQIEADVAAYLGWCSEDIMPFRLLDTDELKTGADKEHHPKYGGVIYIQFKKSEGLEPISKVPSSRRKNRSKKEDIREFRDKNKLNDDPTLYFKLRNQAKNAKDFQHNILRKHHCPPNSYAIYVAPLFLDKEVYYESLFNSCCRYLLDPFYWRLNDKYSFQSIRHIPFLKNHVSIVPHEKVDDSNHYYAYSQAGTDISWHSPSILEHEPRRLSDFIYNLFEDKKREEGYTIQQIVNNIIEIAKNYQVELPLRDFPFRDFPLRDFPFNEYEGEPILLIKKYGEWLKFNYNIKQFLIVRNQNY